MSTNNTKLCSYCSEEILATAIKCKHCGSMINDPSLIDHTRPETYIKLALSNKYELLEEIGRGGMAIVYKARQKNLDRIIALKILPQQFTHDKEFLERFHREARASANLTHPNIVTIFDEGSENGVHFIAMEYLEGSDLYSLISSKKQLSLEWVVSVISPIADALDYAHKKGIVHRDIKSANIIITESGRAVLTDFGIARAISGSKLSQTGSVIGTPEYMSPEQADGKNVDGRSDLFSLGIVLYECLSGELPFKGNNPLGTVYKVINSDPLPLRELRKNLPEWIFSVIHKSLSKQTNLRFQTGKEFSSALLNKKQFEIPTPKAVEKEKYSYSVPKENRTIKITNSNLAIKRSKQSQLNYVLGGLILLLLIAIIAMITTNDKTVADNNIENNAIYEKNQSEINKSGDSENRELNSLLLEARDLSNNLSSMDQADRLLNLSNEILSLAPDNSTAKEYLIQVKSWLDNSIDIASSNKSWDNAIRLLNYANSKFWGNNYRQKKFEINKQRINDKNTRTVAALNEDADQMKTTESDDAFVDKNSIIVEEKSVIDEPVEEEPVYFVAVEEMPEPIGGIAAIQQKIVYPEIAKRAGVEGKVYALAFVDENGNVTNAKIIKGIGAGCDEAALDAVKKTKFKPGKQRGKPVKVQVSIPVVFKLQ